MLKFMSQVLNEEVAVSAKPVEPSQPVQTMPRASEKLVEAVEMPLDVVLTLTKCRSEGLRLKILWSLPSSAQFC